MFLASVAE